VIDQERFDGLARSLATNRLSRAQELKSFAGASLLGCSSARSAPLVLGMHALPRRRRSHLLQSGVKAYQTQRLRLL
jgi:hypothetical protein